MCIRDSEQPGDGAPFLANGDPMTQVPPYCQLSDGIHEITLEVCDIQYCQSEVRIIELVNLPPTLVVDFEPALSPWSELIMPQTGTVVINTNGTSDPEGDGVACAIEFVGYTRTNPEWDGTYTCPETLTYTFDHADDDPPAVFQLKVVAWDEIGNLVSNTVDVMLYNEIAEPVFTVLRNGNTSASPVTLDGSGTVDPEGDALTVMFTSSLDGVLSTQGATWDGYLSRGVLSLIHI